jgi:hypothetical protein
MSKKRYFAVFSLEASSYESADVQFEAAAHAAGIVEYESLWVSISDSFDPTEERKEKDEDSRETILDRIRAYLERKFRNG